MHTSSMLKKEFLKKWIKGLQICCSSKNKMGLMERKKRIKLSADIAMASSKRTATSWSNALISEAKKNNQGTMLVSKLLGPEPPLLLHKRVQCKKILKRSCFNACKKIKKKNNMGISPSNFATIVAKRLVKKRTEVLKRLVPGGESMNEFSLIKETMDYILSLKVQVDVMRSVVTAAEVLRDDKLMK